MGQNVKGQEFSGLTTAFRVASLDLEMPQQDMGGTVPLSEEELRLLEQMERALSAEDPKFASALRGTALRRAQRRHAVLAGIVLAGGVALLMTGVISRMWIVGVVGFLVMLASTSVLLTALRGAAAVEEDDGDHAPRTSFLDRASERWKQRRRDNDL